MFGIYFQLWPIRSTEMVLGWFEWYLGSLAAVRSAATTGMVFYRSQRFSPALKVASVDSTCPDIHESDTELSSMTNNLSGGIPLLDTMCQENCQADTDISDAGSIFI
jgi:hypothetical protein